MTAASCLQFQEITDTSSTRNYIKFTNDGDQHNAGDGCWSYVGEQGGEQVNNIYILIIILNISIFQYSNSILNLKVINLDPGCMREGTVTHEILHALGVSHEQSR